MLLVASNNTLILNQNEEAARGIVHLFVPPVRAQNLGFRKRISAGATAALDHSSVNRNPVVNLPLRIARKSRARGNLGPDERSPDVRRGHCVMKAAFLPGRRPPVASCAARLGANLPVDA